MADDKAKQGDLEVWYIGSKNERRISVPDTQAAIRWINKWTNNDLKDDSIQFNSMGLKVYEDDGAGGMMWQEYYNDDGQDIIEMIDMKEN